MPNLLSPLFLVTTAFVMLCSLSVQAQSLKTAQDRLLQLYNEQSSTQAQIKKLDDLIRTQSAELELIKAKPSPERDELVEAEKELMEAKAAHSTNPSDMNQTSLKNAELKHHLAERKFHKSSASIATLQENIQRNENLRNTLQNSLTVNKSQIDQQKLAIEKALQNAEIEKRLAEQRKQIAEKEALLAAEKARELEKKKALEAKELQAKAEAAKKATEQANGLTKLTDKALVAKEIQRINALVEDNRIKNRVNQFMYIQRKGIEKKNSYVLRDIGHSHYKTELTAFDGEGTLNIGFNKWSISFSSEESGKPFVFLYDVSNPDKPRLIYYLKSLE